MWIVSLEWLLLALAVFWAMGAYKRLMRLRAACRKAFVPVEDSLRHLLSMLREFAESECSAGEAAQHARAALQPTADLLEMALLQAKAQPLQAESIAGLDSSWRSTQVAWQAYVQVQESAIAAQGGESADSALSPWSRRWQQLVMVQQHNSHQFNTAVTAYNQALTQLPASLLAKLLGLQPARAFQKDAAAPSAPTV